MQKQQAVSKQPRSYLAKDSQSQQHLPTPATTTTLSTTTLPLDTDKGHFTHHGFRPECAMLRQEEDG
ncbi:hypothetical protein MW887_000290 [Aspergillus wentii]|nr:hypothetical protein MW887_000290 [Aspergillus wentii]